MGTVVIHHDRTAKQVKRMIEVASHSSHPVVAMQHTKSAVTYLLCNDMYGNLRRILTLVPDSFCVEYLYSRLQGVR